MILHISKAVLACHHNEMSKGQLYSPEDIGADFRKAQSIAEDQDKYDVAAAIERLMEQFHIPTFE
jgi:hypothetical protein